MPQPIKNSFVPDLSQPALRALANAGIKKLEDLARMTEKELGALHGMGPKGMRVLKQGMKEIGLDFKNK